MIDTSITNLIHPLNLMQRYVEEEAILMHARIVDPNFPTAEQYENNVLDPKKQYLDKVSRSSNKMVSQVHAVEKHLRLAVTAGSKVDYYSAKINLSSAAENILTLSGNYKSLYANTDVKINDSFIVRQCELFFTYIENSINEISDMEEAKDTEIRDRVKEELKRISEKISFNFENIRELPGQFPVNIDRRISSGEIDTKGNVFLRAYVIKVLTKGKASKDKEEEISKLNTIITAKAKARTKATSEYEQAELLFLELDSNIELLSLKSDEEEIYNAAMEIFHLGRRYEFLLSLDFPEENDPGDKIISRISELKSKYQLFWKLWQEASRIRRVLESEEKLEGALARYNTIKSKLLQLSPKSTLEELSEAHLETTDLKRLFQLHIDTIEQKDLKERSTKAVADFEPLSKKIESLYESAKEADLTNKAKTKINNAFKAYDRFKSKFSTLDENSSREDLRSIESKIIELQRIFSDKKIINYIKNDKTKANISETMDFLEESKKISSKLGGLMVIKEQETIRRRRQKARAELRKIKKMESLKLSLPTLILYLVLTIAAFSPFLYFISKDIKDIDFWSLSGLGGYLLGVVSLISGSILLIWTIAMLITLLKEYFEL